MDDRLAITQHVAPDPRWPSGLEQEPPLGAHLTTSRRGYSHHGVYVGHGRVVHYSGSSGFWQCGPVEEVSLSQFAVGHAVRVLDHLRSPYSPEEIVRRARARLGENDYRLLTNNCEHFCTWCISGVGRSAQVERRLRLALRLISCVTDTAESAIRRTPVESKVYPLIQPGAHIS
ncbi:MAG: lecithin retinol acyltransferase family protein [Steroidobacteraceae bacterium]